MRGWVDSHNRRPSQLRKVMTKSSFLDKYIEETLTKRNEEQRKNHISSGKLSASMLGNPTQWQILKNIGIPQEPLGEYVVRKFLRGNHVEDWLRSLMPGIVNQETFVEYKDVVGYVDADVDMKDWKLEKVKGIIPHEIKSTANAAFRWIKKDGPKKSHQLQGTLYALAMDAKHFILHYIASDDYRVESFIEETKDFEKEVHEIIEEYNKHRDVGTVPVFEAKEKWQENEKYNNYLDFAELSQDEVLKKIEKEYPDAYKKLLEGIK